MLRSCCCRVNIEKKNWNSIKIKNITTQVWTTNLLTYQCLACLVAIASVCEAFSVALKVKTGSRWQCVKIQSIFFIYFQLLFFSVGGVSIFDSIRSWVLCSCFGIVLFLIFWLEIIFEKKWNGPLTKKIKFLAPKWGFWRTYKRHSRVGYQGS